MLAFRLIFLLMVDWEARGGAGEAVPFAGFLLLIMGRLSMKEWKVFLVASFSIFAISELRSALSALKGEILFLWLFYCSAPKPAPPEASVVLDLELIFCMVSPGLIMGIVLITHR